MQEIRDKLQETFCRKVLWVKVKHFIMDPQRYLIAHHDVSGGYNTAQAHVLCVLCTSNTS